MDSFIIIYSASYNFGIIIRAIYSLLLLKFLFFATAENNQRINVIEQARMSKYEKTKYQNTNDSAETSSSASK